MACSLTCGSADVTCYVPRGDHLLPLCVPASTRLIDLGTVLQKSNVHENEEDSANNKASTSRTVVLITGLQPEGSHPAIENHPSVRILDGQPFNGFNSVDKTNTLEEEGAFQHLHRPMEDHRDNHLSLVTRLNLKGCFLCTYMWSTFQWIEPSETGSYSNFMRCSIKL